MLGGCDSPAARFFNVTERNSLEEFKVEAMSGQLWITCDQLAAAAFIRPEIVTKKTLHHVSSAIAIIGAAIEPK